MENKMTYSVALSTAISALADGEAKNKLIALKNSIENKTILRYYEPSNFQTQNARIKVDILDAMEIGKSYTISDMIKEFECLEGYTIQKVSALVHKLCDTEQIIRSEINRKAYFTVAVAE